jgi:hypothetical protein
MKFVAHRINTVEELLATPKKYGVEVDIRDYKEKLILQHDPFKTGQDLKSILNIMIMEQLY